MNTISTNRETAHNEVFSGRIANLHGGVYMFKNSQGGYTVRYADREMKFSNFRSAYSHAFEAQGYTFIH